MRVVASRIRKFSGRGHRKTSFSRFDITHIIVGRRTDPTEGGFRGIAGPAALVEGGTRGPSGRLGCPVPSPFKTHNHVNGIVDRPMYRNFLIIAGVNDNPQPHGGVPPVVKYHVRLLGVSLYAWV